jgi:hypothetical protein
MPCIVPLLRSRPHEKLSFNFLKDIASVAGLVRFMNSASIDPTASRPRARPGRHQLVRPADRQNVGLVHERRSRPILSPTGPS